MKRSLFALVVFMAVLNSCENKMITSYLVMSYTPSENGISNIKIEQKSYADDSTAICKESIAFSNAKKRTIELMEKEPVPKPGDEMLFKAKMKAYESILKEIRTVVCFTHPDGFDVGEFVKVIRKNGIESNKTRQFINNNDLEVKFVPLD